MISKGKPEAWALLRSILPPSLAQVEWIWDMRGVTRKIELANIGGALFATGMVCKPHDCFDNQILFLIADDGSRSFALVKQSGRAQSYGGPGPAERAYLSRPPEQF
jgi:hypothetical protein